MNPSRWLIALCLALLAPGQAVLGQRLPRVGYVYPAGGQCGTTFQVTLGGQYLDGAAGAYVSGDGVRATVIEHTKPMTQRQANELRTTLRELQKQKDSAQAAKEIAEIREKLNAFNKKANPTIAEIVTVEVTASSDAEPGERELRLATSLGLTNPIVLCMDQLPECCETEPAKNGSESEMSITLPCVVNGQIMPGDVDRFRFQARRGQRLVAAVAARRLIPYLADAVPGWFQATLTLYDANGEELVHSDDYRFHPDPVLTYEVPADGEYAIEVRDAIYRGREDFVYRLRLGELPFVTSIFPLGSPSGLRMAVEATGWNLPATRFAFDARDKEPGVFPHTARGVDLPSNRVPFAVGTLPERRERNVTGSPSDAQRVTLPLIVNGHIDPPGDWDVFGFECRAGDEIVAEVYARRLDSPVDSVLRLTDAAGAQLAFNDDHEDRGAGLTTHHADSLLTAKLPADGLYYLHLGDAQSKGGSEYGYRLRIGPPQPDFALRVVPSSINVRAGATASITAYALRRDGFDGEISLTLQDAPAGFTLIGGRLLAGQEQVGLRLQVPAKFMKEPVSLSLEGHATIQGRVVTRPAVPAEDMMQAFFYRHLVPAKDLKVKVIGRGKPANRAKATRSKSATPARPKPQEKNP